MRAILGISLALIAVPVSMAAPRDVQSCGVQSILVAAVLASDTDADLEQRLQRLERQAAETHAREGAKIFARACAACHGREGRGDGPAADQLKPPPRDLTSSRFRFRSTPSGAPPLPEDIERTIRQGLAGTDMPGYGRLFSDREIGALTAYLESIREARSPVPPAMTIAPPALPDGERTRAEGRAAYVLSGCGTCHGDRGDGRGSSSATLTDELDRPIAVPDFRYHPLKGGRDVVAIVRTLRTGMNGAPMPSYDEAMLFGAEDLETLPESLRAQLPDSPTRAEVRALTRADRDALRDRRLEALAHYVLSFDRRRGAGFRLFREDPEREARSP